MKVGGSGQTRHDRLGDGIGEGTLLFLFAEVRFPQCRISLGYQVIELAKYLGMPRSVIENPPTAGLWEGQTDRKEIGIDYKTLDLILKTLERRETPEFDPRMVAKVKKMIKKTEHKREMPEICELS